MIPLGNNDRQYGDADDAYYEYKSPSQTTECLLTHEDAASQVVTSAHLSPHQRVRATSGDNLWQRRIFGNNSISSIVMILFPVNIWQKIKMLLEVKRCKIKNLAHLDIYSAPLSTDSVQE